MNLFGPSTPPRPTEPDIPNLIKTNNVSFPLNGLLAGLLIMGRKGVGKTRLLAHLIVQNMRQCPELSILVLDASGVLTKDIVGIILTLQERERQPLLDRLVVDIPFHPDYTQTLPFWHPSYGTDKEDQIKKAMETINQLNPDTMSLPFMGRPAMEKMQTELFRVLSAIENEYGETFQITEATKFLDDASQIRNALSIVGMKVPSAREYFMNVTNPSHVDHRDFENRSYAMKSCYLPFESPSIRARVGYYKPSYTMKEVAEHGLCCIVDGRNILGHEKEMNYIFGQEYNFFKAVVDRRNPNYPHPPFMIVFEEASQFYAIPDMTNKIMEISNIYRSRKVIPVIDLQGTWQTKMYNDVERRGFWSMGNVLLFGLDSWDDAKEAVHNITNYEPGIAPVQTPGQPERYVALPQEAGYIQAANWLQHFQPRQVLMKRYLSEGVIDQYIYYVPKVQDIKTIYDGKPQNLILVDKVIEDKFLERAGKHTINEMLRTINERKIIIPPSKPTQQPADK